MDLVRKVTLLLAFMLVVQVFGQPIVDPCQFNTSRNVFELNEIMDCFYNIPVDVGRMSSTLALVRQLTQTYSFTDIAKAKIAPYNLNVDLVAGIDAIDQKTYTRDHGFHMDLSRLFNSLNGAHTEYFVPEPYRACTAVKAFALSAYAADPTSDAVFTLRAQPLAYTSEWNWPINPSDYIGLQVMQINGQDPHDYLMNYADRFGSFKDKLVRFNYLFDRLGWGITDSLYTPLSDTPVEIVTLKKSDDSLVNVNVPVKIYCSSVTWNSTQQFIAQIDNPPPPPSKRSIMNSLDEPDPTPDIRKERLERVQHLMQDTDEIYVEKEMKNMNIFERVEFTVGNRLDAKKRSTGSSLQMLKSLPDKSMYMMLFFDTNNNVVPVLKVTTFSPSNQSAWVDFALEFNAMLAQYNWTYAIVDVNKNGGGKMCNTHLLQAMMDERIASVDVNRTNVLWRPFNMRKSPFFDKIYNNGVQYMDAFYINPRTGGFINPTDYYNAESNTVFWAPGVQSNHTQFFYFQGACIWIAAPLKNVTAWPKQLIVTTDGTCGSACAAFVAKMKQLGTAKIVAIGGDTKYNNTMMRAASFPGGNVIRWADMHLYTNDSTLQSLTTSARPRFNWHQGFATASHATYPLEFDYLAFEPTHRIRDWRMVENDSPATGPGLNNLRVTYEQSVAFWGPFTQTMPDNSPVATPQSVAPLSVAPPQSVTPISVTPVPTTTPVSVTPVSTIPPISVTPAVPINAPVSTIPPMIATPLMDNIDNPDSSQSRMLLWVFIPILVVVVAVIIWAAVVALKRFRQVKKFVHDDERNTRLLQDENRDSEMVDL